MIQLSAIEAVVTQYAKFGWKLERILLKDAIGNVSAVFPDASVVNSSQDALWFSRESDHGHTWELRRLSRTPFALVRVIEASAEDADRDEILQGAEIEMEKRDVKASDEISNGK